MTPLRVGLVCGAARPDLDGVADYVSHLAHHLPEHGVAPVIAAAGAATEPGAVRLAARWSPVGVAAAALALRGLRLDVVHVQFAPSAFRFSGLVGLLPLVLAPRVPLVVTVHEYGSWRWPAWVPPRVWRPLERRRLWDRETGRLVPGSRMVIVTNPAHRRAVEQRFGGRVPVSEVPIGPNVEPALHDPQARASVRAALGLPPDAVLLAFFGFVHPVKGVRYLAQALAALRRERPGLHLLVIGGFESLALPGEQARAFESELRDCVARAGAAAAVTFTGFRPAGEVSRLLAACDVAVLPFTAGVTTKSGALLTVLAHGLPAAVTSAGDPALVDGETVVVIDEVRDPGAIVRALQRLLGDSPLRAHVAAGGRRLARRYEWTGIAARHAAIYQEAHATVSRAGRGHDEERAAR